MSASTSPGLHVAILGATGAVGREFLSILAERDFPVRKLTLLASARSEGQVIEWNGQKLTVKAVKAEHFEGVDVALFSPGASVSKEWAPIAAAKGAYVVDNSSAFRMDADVPLVVPEVNAAALDLARGRRIVANPNCSTIQMVVALKPLHDAATLKRVVVATYQSVSGAGQKGLDELRKQTADLLNVREPTVAAFAHRIAFNVIPQIGDGTDNGYTKEEMKMVEETRKILGLPGLRVSATTVRVPVFYGHSESVNAEFSRKVTVAEARELLGKAPGVKVVDDLAHGIYPMPLLAAGDDATLVGRIREDLSCDTGLELFVVADNVRKGAATNAVQIAELLIQRGELKPTA